MNVKSFGCSFIYGSDLADDPKGYGYYQGSQFSWPALIAKKLNLTYKCNAFPGIGNLQIAESIFREIDKEPSIFIIGWTWIDRFDYQSIDERWHTIRPSLDSVHSDFYYKNLHSQYRDKLTSLIAINSTVELLKNNNHKFIMTYQDELLFETDWHTSAAIETLQNNVRPYMTKFDSKTFLNWSQDCGYKISPNMHPLEDAHRAAANLIESYNLV